MRTISSVGGLALAASLVAAPAYADGHLTCVGISGQPEATLCYSVTPENITPGPGPYPIHLPQLCLPECVTPGIVYVDAEPRYGEVARVRYLHIEQAVVVERPPSGPVGGRQCGLATTRDSTGLVDSETGMVGAAWAGPWVGTETTTQVSMRCTLQFNEETYHGGGQELFSEVTRSWRVGLGYAVANYAPRLDTDNIYLCTEITYVDASGTHELLSDTGSAPGAQCPLVTTAGGGDTLVHSA